MVKLFIALNVACMSFNIWAENYYMVPISIMGVIILIPYLDREY